MTGEVSVNTFLSDENARRQTLQNYRSSGYTALTGLLNSEALALLNHLWDRIGDERISKGKKPDAPLLMPHNSFPEVREVTKIPDLVHVLEFFLGGKIDLIQSQLMFGAPGTKGFSPHQDNYYNRANPPDGIIAAWIALQDVDITNGGVAVYPGSHAKGLARTRRDWLYLASRAPYILKSLAHKFRPGQQKSASDYGVIERFVYAMPDTPITPIVPALKAGSVLLMHGDLVHASGPNMTKDRSRKSLLTNYIRKGTQYSAGKLSGRVTYDVYGS